MTSHARGRMAKWKRISEMVGETLLEPEEVLIGHHDRFIAHRREIAIPFPGGVAYKIEERIIEYAAARF